MDDGAVGVAAELEFVQPEPDAELVGITHRVEYVSGFGPAVEHLLQILYLRLAIFWRLLGLAATPLQHLLDIPLE